MTGQAASAGLLEQAVTLHQTGRLQEADGIYRQVLQAEPDNPVALHLSGLVARQLGDAAEGERLMRRALAVQPQYPEAEYNLANLLRDIGQPDEAAAGYRRVLEMQPGNTGAMNNLGSVLRQIEQDAEAAECYRRALALQPDIADLWDNLGSVLTALGQMDEARAALEQALKLRPGFAKAYRHLSMAKKFHEGDPHLPLMSLALSRPGLTVAEREDLNFAYGKACDDVGQYDEAFKHFAEGNRLQYAGYRYSIGQSRQEFAAIREAFGAALQSPAKGSADETPVFVLGMPRSGTTLVEQIIASHPDVFGAGEVSYLSDTALWLAERKQTAFPLYAPQLSADDLQAAGAHYVARLRKHAPEGVARITDKMPGNFKLIGLIALALPRARIVHCVREPLDTCVSMFCTHFSQSHPYACNLRDLGQYYRLYQELMAFWEQQLPGRIHAVRYETLVADFEPEARRLLQHCGLQWDERCLAFHQTSRRVRTASSAQVRTPLYASSVNAWKRFEKHLGELRDGLGGVGG